MLSVMLKKHPVVGKTFNKHCNPIIRLAKMVMQSLDLIRDAGTLLGDWLKYMKRDAVFIIIKV